MGNPKFKGGINIALKIPIVHFEKTIGFYRDVLGLTLVEEKSEIGNKSYSCQFGPNKLWFDLVENYSQTDIWLELVTNDLDEAAKHLARKGIPLQDELEVLPKDFKGHWISSPARNGPFVDRGKRAYRKH